MNLKKNMSFFNKNKFVTFYHNKKILYKKVVFFWNLLFGIFFGIGHFCFF